MKLEGKDIKQLQGIIANLKRLCVAMSVCGALVSLTTLGLYLGHTNKYGHRKMIEKGKALEERIEVLEKIEGIPIDPNSYVKWNQE